jgi:hypothetical protein
VEGRQMTGRMFHGLAWEYINMINQTSKVQILDVIESVIQSESRKIKDEKTEEFDQKVRLSDSLQGGGDPS